MLASVRILVVAALCAVLCKSAYGERAISVSITLEDVGIMLHCGFLDSGLEEPDTVWNYLKTISFGGPPEPTADGVTLNPAVGKKLVVEVVPDQKDSRHATLTGKIRIQISYGGEAETKSLRLIRKGKSAAWFIDPKQVDELAKVRKPRK